jgi:hypothetical protein
MRGTGKTTARVRRTERGGGTHLVLALLLVLAGCESQFVDPHPPELSLLSREQVVKVVDAPVVYGLVFDLHLPDATECTRVKARLTQAFRATLLPAGRVGQELSAQDLSPGCYQTNTRRMNLSTYDQQFREAEARFGVGRVKPVLLYFNNVELPPSSGLQADFSSLRFRSSAPLLWALATPDALQGLTTDQSAPWTYSADPALTTRLEEAARTQFPLVLLEQPPADGFPLFTPQELASVREFKGCSYVNNVTGLNFVYGTKTVQVDTASPPRFQVKVPPQQGPVARTASTLKPVTAHFEVEVCRANCERLYSAPPDGELIPWALTPRCLLKG